MAMIPVYGFVEGDTMGVVVLAEPDGTALELAEKLIAAASVRVARRDPFTLMFEDRILDPGATLRTQGVEPLVRVSLVWG